MIITPIVIRPRTLYKPMILRQLAKNGCIYFHSIEPVNDARGVELQYSYKKVAQRVANKAAERERINILV